LGPSENNEAKFATATELIKKELISRKLNNAPLDKIVNLKSIEDCVAKYNNSSSDDDSSDSSDEDDITAKQIANLAAKGGSIRY